MLQLTPASPVCFLLCICFKNKTKQKKLEIQFKMYYLYTSVIIEDISVCFLFNGGLLLFS